MINKEAITIEWLNQVTKTHNKIDKILTEKVIRALLLLEGLVKYKLPFIFKGGTALMLHLNSTKRLSIDIDIILPQKVENLDQILEVALREQGFLRKELNHRSSDSNIKKEHYKFFYSPIHKTNQEEEYILLDILFEEAHYSKTILMPISSAFLPIVNEPMVVSIPSLEDLLGDKLTAFAPNTTGIPYFKKESSASMEIIKQLYDVGSLFDVVNDVEIIKKTFHRFSKAELVYRKAHGKSEADVLEDIYQTSLCLVTRGKNGKGNFEELQEGVKRVSSFIFSENYHIEKVISHASKAAYLSTLIKYDASTIEKFTNPSQIKDWLIKEPLDSKLNKLKKSNPEAFFYWYRVYELTIQNSN